MDYLTRKDVIATLKLSVSRSYRIIGTTSERGLISKADVVMILNNARRGGQQIVNDIPTDLGDAEDVSREIENVTARDLRNWSHRKLNPVPHFRLNGHCYRYCLSAVKKWMDERTKIVHIGY